MEDSVAWMVYSDVDCGDSRLSALVIGSRTQACCAPQPAISHILTVPKHEKNISYNSVKSAPESAYVTMLLFLQDCKSYCSMRQIFCLCVISQLTK